jgi:Flp pilus assembly protein CpaB
MQTKKRSPFTAIVLAGIIGVLVIALLNGVVRPTQVVVARVPIAPGTLLTAELVELRTIPAGAKPTGAVTKVEEAAGKMVAVGRAPGDMIVQSVLGELAGAGLPAELPEGHIAMAIHVDLASGVAGLLRAGQTVTVIGMISPDLINENPNTLLPVAIPEFSSPALTPNAPMMPTPEPTATPTPAPPSAPLARLAITGLKVLMVPQPFRYEEVPAGASEEQLFASARTSAASQDGSVIVVQVPTTAVEVTPGFKVDPPTLLAALDQYGLIHLALEPASGVNLDVSDVVTLNLGELYEEMNEHRKKE